MTPNKPDLDRIEGLAGRLRYTARINSQRFDDDHPLVGELRQADDDFRASMPPSTERDPVTLACERAMAALSRTQK